MVEASPAAVFSQILALKQQEVRALGSEYHDALTLDEAQRTITLTGHWWYQGTHTVHPHLKGSQVTYTVRNVARVARTLAFLQRPRYVQQMRHDFGQLLQQVGGQLGCAWMFEQAS